MKGQLDLMTPAMAVANELLSVPSFDAPEDVPFAVEKGYIKNFKKAVLMVAGSAAQKLMANLAKEQEILMNAADMVIDTYIAESLLLRVERLVELKGAEAAQVYVDIAQVFINDAADRINKAGKEAVNSFAEGDEQRVMLMGLKRFTKVQPLNARDARRRIAAKLIEDNKYNF